MLSRASHSFAFNSLLFPCFASFICRKVFSFSYTLWSRSLVCFSFSLTHTHTHTQSEAAVVWHSVISRRKLVDERLKKSFACHCSARSLSHTLSRVWIVFHVSVKLWIKWRKLRAYRFFFRCVFFGAAFFASSTHSHTHTHTQRRGLSCEESAKLFLSLEKEEKIPQDRSERKNRWDIHATAVVIVTSVKAWKIILWTHSQWTDSCERIIDAVFGCGGRRKALCEIEWCGCSAALAPHSNLNAFDLLSVLLLAFEFRFNFWH